MKLNSTLVENIRITHGEEGENWLSELPSLLERLLNEWQLTLDGEFNDLTYHYVAPVKMNDGRLAALKIGPHIKAIHRQALALEAFGGVGAVNLYQQSAQLGALLMERASVSSVVESIHFCSVAKRLLENSHEKSEKFPHISVWGLGFEKYLRTETEDGEEAREAGLIDDLVRDADRLFKDLVTTTTQETLLHGDLHHSNILRRENGEWVAIDPKGVWGDPAYEAGAFLRNPMPQILTYPDLDSVLAERIELISRELNFDKERVLHWAYVQAVLASIWSVADGPVQVARWLRVATALSLVA